MTTLKFFTDFIDTVEDLGDAELGRLMRAVFKYAQSEEEPNLTGGERLLWRTVKQIVDRQRETYDRVCERNKANIGKRWDTTRINSIPDDTKGYESIPNDTTGTRKEKKEEKVEEYNNVTSVKEDTISSSKVTSPKEDTISSSNVTKYIYNTIENTFPPTLEEVRGYVRSNSYRVDANKFFSHYSANGWRDRSGDSLNDWKKVLDSWENSLERGAKHDNSRKPVKQVSESFRAGVYF